MESLLFVESIYSGPVSGLVSAFYRYEIGFACDVLHRGMVAFVSVVGDQVRVEMTSYDPEKNRIVYRKQGQALWLWHSASGDSLLNSTWARTDRAEGYVIT